MVKQTRTILIVEDNVEIRESLQFILEHCGYRVLSATDGRQALELLQRRPLPDAAIVDLMMPIMSGWELLDVVSQDSELAAIPIAITTAVADHAPPGYRVFRKPYAIDSILRFFEACSDQCLKKAMSA